LLQSLFWSNAGFDKLRIEELHGYDARYDPTVIPIADSTSHASVDYPAPRKRETENGYLTAADYHELYISGKLTPTAVADSLLPLIRRDAKPAGEHSTAFTESKVDINKAAAAASTERYKQGQPLGFLDGVPVVVKVDSPPLPPPPLDVEPHVDKLTPG
jgi:hypothetical protein